MRVLQVSNRDELRQIMRDIKVDPCGIKIMLPKGIEHILKINSLSNISANILKQEMLSLGADAAIARDALTGKTKKTDCLLMGSLSQFGRLKEKLNRQPFGLDKLGQGLALALKNYEKDTFTLRLGKYKLNLGRRTRIMGILNLTPDSFSGDGLYQSIGIVEFVETMIRDGADIIDIGGESSRPGAKPVSAKEELSRIIPVLKALAKKIKVPISVDTYKPEVAERALANGAAMINDITGLRNPKMAKVVAKYKAAVAIMHMQGNPCTMQKNPRYVSLIDEIIEYLAGAINRAEASGIDKEKIIIDPGIGFGKTTEQNLQILKRLSEFKALGKPILVGPSRKSFIGRVLNLGPQERLFGTISSCVLAAAGGAKILRVHDVKEVKQALKVADTINNI